MGSVGSSYILYVMGDLNEWVWDRISKDITIVFWLQVKMRMEGEW